MILWSWESCYFVYVSYFFYHFGLLCFLRQLTETADGEEEANQQHEEEEEERKNTVSGSADNQNSSASCAASKKKKKNKKKKKQNTEAAAASAAAEEVCYSHVRSLTVVLGTSVLQQYQRFYTVEGYTV